VQGDDSLLVPVAKRLLQAVYAGVPALKHVKPQYRALGLALPQVRGAAAPRDADPGPAQGGLVEAAAVEAPW
jgi:hypothetical protein